MGQIWLALGILAAKLEKSEGSVGTQAPREIQIRDRQARLLRIGEREVSLAPQPFCLLAYLYDNPGRVCTHEELIAKVFHGKYDAEYLHSLIGRIRKAIGDDAKHPDHLITIPNTGYRLILKP
jgi:two-component system KDP operon response regulator KdpE